MKITIAVCESHVTDIDDARHSETKKGGLGKTTQMPVTSAGRFLDEASSADVILVVNIVT